MISSQNHLEMSIFEPEPPARPRRRVRDRIAAHLRLLFPPMAVALPGVALHLLEVVLVARGLPSEDLPPATQLHTVSARKKAKPA